jgi:CheY-like chemotaxis protein
MHGGRVEAHSAGAGTGSEFVVYLPVPPLALAAANDSAEPPSRMLSAPRRVLVVDDSPDAVESLSMILRVWGHEVHTAADGPTALHEAEALRPEVVLLDIGLPGMDGYEVARRLREQVRLIDTLLIALTGYGQDEDRRRVAEAGFDTHLVKPADLTVLQKLLAEPVTTAARTSPFDRIS